MISTVSVSVIRCWGWSAIVIGWDSGISIVKSHRLGHAFFCTAVQKVNVHSCFLFSSVACAVWYINFPCSWLLLPAGRVNFAVKVVYSIGFAFSWWFMTEVVVQLTHISFNNWMQECTHGTSSLSPQENVKLNLSSS